jgi:uncharacterized protein (TIGR02099 family)
MTIEVKPHSLFSSMTKWLRHTLLASILSMGVVCGRGASKTVIWTCKLLLIAYFVFGSLILVLRFFVLPNVEHYKSDIEQYASEKIGRNISIAKIHASWDGLNPRFSLSDIVIRDQAGNSALELPKVNATISWWSFAVLNIRFANIEVVKPSLRLKLDAQGNFFIAGFSIKNSGQTDDAGLNWVLAQHQIMIEEGTVLWTDQKRSVTELRLNNVQFVLNNQWHHHQFALRANPPSALAAPIDIRGNFNQSVFSRKKSDLSSWSGDLYADLSKADLPAIQFYIDLPFKIEKAKGAVRAWVSLDKGRIADFTADVQLTDVLGKFRKDLPKLDMAKVSGRIMASEPNVKNRRYLPEFMGSAGHTLALTNFSMETREGVVLPKTTLSQQFYPAEKGKAERNELHAQFLDLESVANFVEHLPLPKEQRQLLIDLKPKGQLKDFVASWQGTFPEVMTYKIKGEFTHLSLQALKAQLARPKQGQSPALAAVPAIPGFENLSGSVDANDKGGSFYLDSKEASLQLPSYFVDPVMPFEELYMQAHWQFQPNNRLLFQVSKMDFKQENTVGAFSGKHLIAMGKTFAENKGDIDIVGSLNHFDVKTIKRFIPEHAPVDLRNWLSNALLDGEANDVKIILKGDMNYFPFNQKDPSARNKGEFSIQGKIDAGKLNFSPEHFAVDGVSPYWPIIDNIQGGFIFDRTKMEITADKAVTNGALLSKVKAVIADLSDENSPLVIDGVASGSLQSMFNYVKASPVDEWIGGFLHESTALGNSQLNLKLQLPLHHLIESKVNGTLQFYGNETKLQTDLPKISNLNGRLDFNEYGVSFNGLKGNMLGGAVNGIGTTAKDGAIRIKLDGSASAEGLQAYLTDPSLLALTQKIYGATRYSSQINVKKGQSEIIIESSMQGLGLNMPAPLIKPMQEVLPIRLEITPDLKTDVVDSNNPISPNITSAVNQQNLLRDEVKLTIGSLLNARYQRKKSREKNASWKVIRGGIGIFSPAPWPESGVHAHVVFNTLNIDEWSSLLRQKIVKPVATSLISNQLESNQSSVDINIKNENKNENKIENAEKINRADIFQYIEPNAIAVQTEELHVLGKKLDKVVLGASNQQGVWQANVDAVQASGYATWSASKQDLGHVTAILSRLIIPKSAANDVGDLLEGKNTTQQIPSLDIVAENFELFDKKLGRLELLASNSVDGNGRNWSINKLNLKSPDAQFNATGKWLLRENANITNLNYVLEIADSGELLERLDYPDVMRGGKGRLEGNIQWNGLPFLMDMPSLSGQVKMKLEAGQFLQDVPAAAKLLGVLSMQSLPRRLTLDFRDVFSEGFAFDNVVGDAVIEQGIARTNNFKMSSINAAVLIEGKADVVKESQDLHVAVIPDLNAGAASVVYALAVNPVIGLGTFLAQLLFRDPLKRAFTYEYTITGPWKNPVVTKLENKEREIYLEKQKAEKLKLEKQKADKAKRDKQSVEEAA